MVGAVPSPQSIETVYCAATPPGAVSMNEATVWLVNAEPTTALNVSGMPMSGASATFPVELIVVVEPPSSLIVTLTAYEPNDLYVFEPVTLKTPLPTDDTTPLVTWPSPQSIEAVKSVNGAFTLASLNEPTTPENFAPSVAGTVSASPASGASSTEMPMLPVPEVPVEPVTEIVCRNVPSSAYVCVPVTPKNPPPRAVTTPAVGPVPSPQSIVAVYVCVIGDESVNCATWTLVSAAPSVAVTPAGMTLIESVGTISNIPRP